MPGIEDRTPGLEDVSKERFKANFKNQLIYANARHIHNYLLLDKNTQWSVQLDLSSLSKTRVIFRDRSTPVVIHHTHWRRGETITEELQSFQSFHEAFEKRYPDKIQDTTRLLFCYAVIYNLLKASAVPAEGLRRCFFIDIRKLREAVGLQ
jgi:hypothetical protein